MAAEIHEQHLKKKIQAFQSEMVKVGTVKGFKYFAMYMRGREEMVISIQNEPQNPDNSYIKDMSEVTAHYTPSPSGSFNITARNLPYDKRSLMLSARTQLSLSGLGHQGVGLPPASPSDREIAQGDENSTLFLLAAYGRYNCPYVWVRSNHERLVKLNRDSDTDKDSPLRMKSTLQWRDGDVHVWEILSELVKLCTVPCPRNPYEVDFEYFDNLPQNERILASGAMINFLQKVFLNDTQDRSYTAKVLEDLQFLTKRHFKDIKAYGLDEGFAILQGHSPRSAYSSNSSPGLSPRHTAGVQRGSQVTSQVTYTNQYAY